MPAAHRPDRPRRGFTLVELLVVLAIVALISAVALPVVLPALNERKIGEAARLLQAVLAGARDTAVRAGAPRGVRFLVDPLFNGQGGNPLASNRMIAIEPGPDYAEGLARTPDAGTITVFGASVVDRAFYVDTVTPPTAASPIASDFYLRVAASPGIGLITNPPTGWSYNIRQGDKIRFDDSGNFYTVAGPIAPGPPNTFAAGINWASANNPERYIRCPPQANAVATAANMAGWLPEYLHLTNGLDDDGDGWVDESCDGIDNDNDGVIDPGFNGIDDNKDGVVDDPLELYFNANAPAASSYVDMLVNEFEREVFVGTQVANPPQNDRYVIYRRPVISPGAKETSLPDGIVLDLTTWNAPAAIPNASNPERSRLPVDPYTGFVDVMIAPNGQVVLPAVGGGGNLARSPIASAPFYHFWLTEREGVNGPLWNTAGDTTLRSNPGPSTAAAPRTFLLPMPKGTVGSKGVDYAPLIDNPKDATQAYSSNPVYLTGQRRMVTLFVRTGQVLTTSIETFDANDTNRPYYDAQAGIKESQ